MPHVVTSLCLRDGACVDVCPSESIVPGFPESEWPWYYIAILIRASTAAPA